VLCPNCVTADDLIADRHPSFWIDRKTGVARIACGCGADLGEVPETRPTEITCLSCGTVMVVKDAVVGVNLEVKKPAA
jgi:hypothetical protein